MQLLVLADEFLVLPPHDSFSSFCLIIVNTYLLARHFQKHVDAFF